MRQENFLDPDFVALDARNQESRQQITEILNESGQGSYEAQYGFTPVDAGTRNQPNGFLGLNASAEIDPGFINLQRASNSLSADVALTLANTFYDGASVALAPATWLIIAHITFSRTVAAACQFTGRLFGASAYASGEVSAPASAFAGTLTLTTILTLVTNTTIKTQGACTSTDGSIKAACPDNPSGNNATQIIAVRLA